MKKEQMQTKEKPIKYAAVIFFVAYLIVCLFCVKEYGVTADESIQRLRSLVAYKYINKTILGRDVAGLEYVPELKDFDHQYYGTAIQMPMVLIEDITGFSMTSHQIFLMRHYMTFAIVFIGYVCLYLALRGIIGRASWLPLITVMMISLYPRFFSFQFFDIKNLMFVGLGMITIATTVAVVEKRRCQWLVMFGLISAITTNCRMMGIVFPMVLVGYFILSDAYEIREIVQKQNGGGTAIVLLRRATKYEIIIGSFFLFWYIINPIAWDKPIESFANTFTGFSHYKQWSGTMVFMGRLITCEEMPWYYLPVWFVLTIPLTYILFFAVGNICVIRESIYSKAGILKSIVDKNKWFYYFLTLFWGNVLAVIILRSRIYVGWHHMYYVFVPFCVIAAYGIKSVCEKGRTVAIVIMFLTLAINVVWIWHNFPSITSYFNSVGKHFATEFDREEWRTSCYTALKWIVDEADSPVSIGGETTAYDFLTEEQKEKVILGDPNPTYIINGYRNVIGNSVEYDGWEEIKTISVDGYNVCSVFRKIE